MHLVSCVPIKGVKFSVAVVALEIFLKHQFIIFYQENAVDIQVAPALDPVDQLPNENWIHVFSLQ
jgi:hypothetical protein